MLDFRFPGCKLSVNLGRTIRRTIRITKANKLYTAESLALELASVIDDLKN